MRATDDEFERWVRDNPPPSLDELIRTHGDYLSIPPDAWLKWDQDVWDWQQRRRDRLVWGAR